jgi:hypothetical protein
MRLIKFARLSVREATPFLICRAFGRTNPNGDDSASPLYFFKRELLQLALRLVQTYRRYC